jgi:hypothetical protein
MMTRSRIKFLSNSAMAPLARHSTFIDLFTKHVVANAINIAQVVPPAI